MVLTKAEFVAEFSGEGDLVEFKQGVSASRVQEVVVAFSNAEGGVLLCGVRDDGTVAGLSNIGEQTRRLHEAVAGTHNPGRYEVRELTVDEDVVLVLSVHRRREGFAQMPDGVVRVRRGASNPGMLGAELSRFMARRAFESFETTATDLEVGAADPDLLVSIADAFGWPDDDQIEERLIEAGFAERDGASVRLTVAGGLLLLEEPADLGCRAFVDMRRYNQDSPDPNKTWSIHGSAAEQIETTTRSILDELGSTSVVLGVQRVEMPRLPPDVVREAVANAVAHRSYESAGTAIRVEIHPDSVSITSPGQLPEPVTIENLRVQQAARNDRLLGGLRRLGLAEDLGRGIDRIEDGMQADLLEPPTFAEDAASFTVTLPLGGAVTPRERAWIRRLMERGKLDPRAGPALVHAAREGSVTNSDVRTLLNIDSVHARSLLQDLVTAGALEQRGERGGAQYVIAPGLGIPARIRYSDAELEATVLRLAEAGPVTNTLVRDETDLDRVNARAVLRRLVDRGVLSQRGSRRGTHYVLATPRGRPSE